MSGGGERWYAEKRMLVVITNIWRGKPSRGTSQPVPSCRRGLKIPQTQDSRGSTHTSINKRTPVTSGPTGCKTSFFQGFLIHTLETEAIHRGESLGPDKGFGNYQIISFLSSRETSGAVITHNIPICLFVKCLVQSDHVWADLKVTIVKILKNHTLLNCSFSSLPQANELCHCTVIDYVQIIDVDYYIMWGVTYVSTLDKFQNL